VRVNPIVVRIGWLISRSEAVRRGGRGYVTVTTPTGTLQSNVQFHVLP
jgi:hypothetical protein